MTNDTFKTIVKETAEKICDLTGYGQALHPNDIIPDIKSSLIKVLESLVEREEKQLEKWNFEGVKSVYNQAKHDTISYIRSEIEKLK